MIKGLATVLFRFRFQSSISCDKKKMIWLVYCVQQKREEKTSIKKNSESRIKENMRWIYDEERTENTNEGLRLNKMDNTLYESTVCFTHKAQ